MQKPAIVPPWARTPSRVRDVQAAGVTRSRLRNNDMARPLHGVVVATGQNPGETSFETRVSAIRLLLSPGHFLSRRTACRLLGIPVQGPSWEHRPDLDIGSVNSLSPLRRAGVRAHRISLKALGRLPEGPLWLPDPADSWCLLSQHASYTELVAAGDYLISGENRWKQPLATLEVLQAAVARFSGCAGGPLRRRAIAQLRAGVESPAESELRLIIVGAHLPEPKVSCVVETAIGRFRSDLGYPAARIAIEHEGAYHFGSVEQARKDIARHEAMRAAGWTVLLTTARDLRDPRNFLTRLRAALDA